MTWPSFLNMLSPWQWAILAAVPPAIIALYFLKLKRRPLEVPSTYLWQKSIEDLHVNSIWQRLRRNLLLFLQLLLLLLVILALLRPHWQARTLTGDRFIFLIDNSASMQATDAGSSRLDEAKRRAGELIDQMKSGDVAMIVSFADSARIEQTFTDNRRRLRRSLQKIQPTQRSTSLLEALKVASGLANPGSIVEEDSEFQVAEALPADLYVFSDGRFSPVTGFSLGNLEPHFVPIGRPDAANVGILAFSVRQSEANPELLQAFARLKNFGNTAVDVSVELFLDDRLIDADQLEMADDEARGVAFDLGAVETGVLKLKATRDGDMLAVDDEAWTVVSRPRHADVLLVTPGNEALELGLQTGSMQEIADVTVETPEFLKSKEYLAAADGGAYDLVIYDRCQPAEKMPQANTLFIRDLPPAGNWVARPEVDLPQILYVNTAHPLMQWIDMGNVTILKGTPLEVPAGGSVLIDSDGGDASADIGGMLVIAPREQFEDLVQGFAFIDEDTGEDGKSEEYIGTDWPSRQSFPVFLLNLLNYFGGVRDVSDSGAIRPGKPVVLEVPSPKARLRFPRCNVVTPGGDSLKLQPGKLGKFRFTDTDELGVYEAFSRGEPVKKFAVNLFDAAESDIRPKRGIKIGSVPVAGRPGWEIARREIWKGLLLVGLFVLLLEWYIYNRRVYI